MSYAKLGMAAVAGVAAAYGLRGGGRGAKKGTGRYQALAFWDPTPHGPYEEVDSPEVLLLTDDEGEAWDLALEVSDDYPRSLITVTDTVTGKIIYSSDDYSRVDEAWEAEKRFLRSGDLARRSSARGRSASNEGKMPKGWSFDRRSDSYRKDYPGSDLKGIVAPGAGWGPAGLETLAQEWHGRFSARGSTSPVLVLFAPSTSPAKLARELDKMVAGYRSPAHAAAVLATTYFGDDPKKGRAARGRRAKASAPAHGVKVGDVFTSSWGYDQTNVEFYKVVSLRGKTMVEVMKMGQAPVSYSTGSVKVEAAGDVRGPSLRRKVSISAYDGKPSIAISSYEYAYIWSGQPQSQTAPGWGH